MVFLGFLSDRALGHFDMVRFYRSSNFFVVGNDIFWNQPETWVTHLFVVLELHAFLFGTIDIFSSA